MEAELPEPSTSIGAVEGLGTTYTVDTAAGSPVETRGLSRTVLRLLETGNGWFPVEITDVNKP